MDLIEQILNDVLGRLFRYQPCRHPLKPWVVRRVLLCSAKGNDAPISLSDCTVVTQIDGLLNAAGKEYRALEPLCVLLAREQEGAGSIIALLRAQLPHRKANARVGGIQFHLIEIDLDEL